LRSPSRRGYRPRVSFSVERISLEVTNRCGKACAFCYNRSHPDGGSEWPKEQALAFLRDCIAHGTRAVSFGGGEPLEYPELFELLSGLRGLVFRSVTTNGLLLDDPESLRLLGAAAPDKVHLSLHCPEDPRELSRVVRQVGVLESLGIRSGVNLLVGQSAIPAAETAAAVLRAAGIGNERIIYLPRRPAATPSPREQARVACDERFQAPSGLVGCRPSERFCSVSWDRRAARCAYTSARARLEAPTFAALASALESLEHVPCGAETPTPSE